MRTLNSKINNNVVGWISVIALTVGLSGCGAAPVGAALPDSPGPPVSIEPKLVPPDDKILFIIGQDLESIREYNEALPEPQPGGVTVYANMVVNELSPFPPLGGLTRGEDDDAKVTGTANSQSAPILMREFPHSSLVVALYIADEDVHGCSTRYLDDINAGKYDELIDEMGGYFKALDRPVYLRIGYEFDGYWNCFQPEPHKKAFVRIVERLRALGADNVASVWQSATWPFDNTDWEKWYPGDEVVDWIGFSLFLTDQGYHEGAPPDPNTIRDSLLAFARSRNKPVMVAESANQGYDNAALTRSVITKKEVQPRTPEQIWQEWYHPYFEYIYANADVIRAVIYINSLWDIQQMWNCREGFNAGQPGCLKGYWGDTRVQVNPQIKAKWVEELSKDRWLHAGPDLFKILGLP